MRDFLIAALLVLGAGCGASQAANRGYVNRTTGSGHYQQPQPPQQQLDRPQAVAVTHGY